MGQGTVTLEQSETVRGTGDGACCIDTAPISLDVDAVYNAFTVTVTELLSVAGVARVNQLG